MNREEILNYLQENLSQKRMCHTLAVANMAEKFAEKQGLPKEKIGIAALLHDVLKEKNKEFLLQYVNKSDILYPKQFYECPSIWHGFAGANFIEQSFGIEEIDVIHAIKYHTVGRENMSMTERIIFVSDLVSLDRTFPEVERLRNLLFDDFEAGFLEALAQTITFLLTQKKTIYQQTIDTYHYYLEIKKRDFI